MASHLSLQCLKSTLWRQWIAGIAAMIMMFVGGLSIGWPSPYFAKFTSGDSTFPATVDEMSWMALVPNLGRIVGAIIGAVCIEYFGSKTVMIGNGCLFIISWVLVILANSVSYIYASRFLGGVCAEVTVMSYSLFFGDISGSGIRGALIILAGNGGPIGILAGNAMGYYLSMKLFAGITLIPIIFFILILLWIPHSPYYLMSKGETEDAKKSILRYNPKANVQLEMDSIKQFLAISKSKTFVDRLREFNIPRYRKAGVIIMALATFTGFSGLHPLTTYMESIMTRGKITVVAPAMVPVMVNGFGIAAGWVTMYLVEKYGRKMMWVLSSAGVCGALISLGTHFYLIDHGFDSTRLQWLPIFSILIFKIFHNIGLHCVPVILIGELFASNIRTLAACAIGLGTSVIGALAMYFYQFLVKHIDDALVLWIHAIFMFLSVIFGFVLVPETKAKTLLEIQDEMMTKK